MASRNVRANENNDDDCSSDSEHEVAAAFKGYGSRPKVLYGDRMPFRQGTMIRPLLI